jgi:hypothetical protein
MSDVDLDRQQRAVGLAILRQIRPMITLRAPEKEVLARAHEVNNQNGRLLLARTIAECVATEMHWSTHRQRCTP